MSRMLAGKEIYDAHIDQLHKAAASGDIVTILETLKGFVFILSIQ